MRYLWNCCRKLLCYILTCKESPFSCPFSQPISWNEDVKVSCSSHLGSQDGSCLLRWQSKKTEGAWVHGNWEPPSDPELPTWTDMWERNILLKALDGGAGLCYSSFTCIHMNTQWNSKLGLMTYIYSGGGGLVTKSCPTLATPWTEARQTPLSMGFSRQEYWSGLPFPSSGDLPDPGIEPQCPALQADSLLTELPEKSIYIYVYISESLSSIPGTNKILFCQLYCQLYFSKKINLKIESNRLKNCTYIPVTPDWI